MLAIQGEKGMIGPPGKDVSYYYNYTEHTEGEWIKMHDHSKYPIKIEWVCQGEKSYPLNATIYVEISMATTQRKG